ncbi:MAG: MFS family permease [Cellvibrionaceae bacterium]|jgi:MFS family permease
MVGSLVSSFRSFNRSIRLFLLASLLLGLGVDGVYAVLFNLFMLRLGYEAEFIGVVNSAGLFAFAFVGLPSGLLGSRWGSRVMLVGGLVFVLTGAILLPFAEFSPEGWQAGWLIVSYVLLMGGWSAVFVNGSPFMMSSVSDGNRNSLFSIQVAVASLASFAGSLIGGFLPDVISRFSQIPITDPAPYRYPMQVMAFLMVPAIFLMLGTDEPDKEIAESGRTGEKRPMNLWLLPIALIVAIAFIRLLQVAGLAATATFINVYLDSALQQSTSRIGLLTSFSRLAGVAGALLFPYLTRKYSNITVAIVGSLGAALFILPIAFIPIWWVAGLGFICARFLTGMRYPAFQVYILEMFETRYHALMSGVMALAAGLSFALMALSGGYIITLFSFRNLFLTGSSITIVGSLILIVFHFYRLKSIPLSSHS